MLLVIGIDVDVDVDVDCIDRLYRTMFISYLNILIEQID